MSLFDFYLNFLLLLDLSLLLLIAIGLFRISDNTGFFYRLLTPVQNAPEKIRDLIHNGRAVLTVIVLSFMLLFWVTCFNPWHAWTGLFGTLAITFLCFRRVTPLQFVLLSSLMVLSCLIAFYMTEFLIIYLLSMVPLTASYFTNRFILSGVFRSERTTTAISTLLLLFLVLGLLIATAPISYRLKGLGWF
ncbi:MAG: hypothetical protein KA801_12195 [Syntrophorhabdaceae bacterium]|nr:hypothetical protein [Syntrophorhabdaceae bacterium]